MKKLARFIETITDLLKDHTSLRALGRLSVIKMFLK